MDRAGYDTDSCIDSDWPWIMYRGMLASAMRGKRGRAFLSDLLAALDAMPEKCLVAEALDCEDGVCALGALARARSTDVSALDPENAEAVAATFGIATPLAREVAYENDEGTSVPETPEDRWRRMRRWVERSLREAEEAAARPKKTRKRRRRMG